MTLKTLRENDPATKGPTRRRTLLSVCSFLSLLIPCDTVRITPQEEELCTKVIVCIAYSLRPAAAMGFIAIGFIFGLVSGYTYSLPPIRRMFCNDCSEDTRREKFVRQRIILKKIVLCKESLVTGSNAVKDDHASDTNRLFQTCCAICWSPYRDGDTACLSSNKMCKHAYHADCVMPWLLEQKRNDCPLCRRNFLSETS